MKRSLTALVALLAATAAAGTTAPPGDSASSVTIVMSGLEAPRGLSFAPNGDLYVAEAGFGAPCTAANEIVLPPRNLSVCIGTSGAVSRLAGGRQERVVTALPSWLAKLPPPMVENAGPSDVAVRGGRLFVTIGWGGTPADRARGAAAGQPFGYLLRIGPSGRRLALADVAGFEQAFNPAGGPVDAQPYGLLAEPARSFIADAGANALLEMRPNGDVSLVTTFPPAPNPAGCMIPFPPPGAPAPPASEPVPTTVVRGPDGALYVGELTGFPFCAGAARVWRIPRDGEPQVYATGFKMIIDVAPAPDGALYVLQYATSPAMPGGPGQIVRVEPGGEARSVVDTGGVLQQPTSLALGPDGALYVSNRGITPGGGEVLRIVH